MTMTCEEISFADRVAANCEAGLTQTEMAEAEGLTLGGFRARLANLGLEIRSDTRRELVRTRTAVSFRELRQRGEIEISDPAPVRAVA